MLNIILPFWLRIKSHYLRLQLSWLGIWVRVNSSTTLRKKNDTCTILFHAEAVLGIRFQVQSPSSNLRFIVTNIVGIHLAQDVQIHCYKYHSLKIIVMKKCQDISNLNFLKIFSRLAHRRWIHSQITKTDLLLISPYFSKKKKKIIFA